MTTQKPAWLRLFLRARGTCEICGERPAATQWAGTGELICWACCADKRVNAGQAR